LTTIKVVHDAEIRIIAAYHFVYPRAAKMNNRINTPPEDTPTKSGKATKSGTMAAQRALADFMEVFKRASGLPLALTRNEGTSCFGMEIPGFCQLIHHTQSSHIRQICKLFNHHLEEMAVDHPNHARCFAGIDITAVPLRENLKNVGFLKTGHVMPQQPDAGDFHKVMHVLSRAGLDCLAQRVKVAWLAIPVMDPERYQAFGDLLAAFARQISDETPESEQIPDGPDSHALRAAQQYIEKNSAKRLKLTEVARAVGLSPNYFCRKFRDFTGLSFTDYLAGIRVASAARLLRGTNKRINEIAYETGFNSISQFNRVFRITMDMSPSAYRHKLLL